MDTAKLDHCHCVFSLFPWMTGMPMIQDISNTARMEFNNRKMFTYLKDRF